MNPDVSVVVCARNEEKFIGHCLEALDNQTARPEIVVIDGNSTDRTVRIAKRYADVIKSDEGKGIAHARNLGCRLAKRGIVAYCDADARPPRSWVENIARLMDGYAAIHGPLMPYDAKRRTTRFTMKVWTDLFMQAGSMARYPIICAANVAFRKDMLKKYPFRFNAPTEDFDVGRRMKQAGRIRFFRELAMPVSARRYEHQFYSRTAVLYLRNYVRVVTGKEPVNANYFESKG